MKPLDAIAQIKVDLLCILSVLPKAVLFFSEIIPCLLWLEFSAFKKCEKIRKRINRAVATFMPTINGFAFRHVDIKGGLHGFYRRDHTHLSDIALDSYNLDLQTIIELRSGWGCQTHYNVSGVWAI